MTGIPSGRSEWEQAARVIRVAIHTVAREAFGSSSVAREVEALPGLRAAVLARDVATRCVCDYAAAARGEGHSWGAVADALGVEQVEDLHRGHRAFLHIVRGVSLRTEDPLWGQHTPAHWRCVSCGQYITDHWPAEAHPADNEEGHTPDCARHTGEITAYLAGWGEQQ